MISLETFKYVLSLPSSTKSVLFPKYYRVFPVFWFLLKKKKITQIVYYRIPLLPTTACAIKFNPRQPGLTAWGVYMCTPHVFIVLYLGTICMYVCMNLNTHTNTFTLFNIKGLYTKFCNLLLSINNRSWSSFNAYAYRYVILLRDANSQMSPWPRVSLAVLYKIAPHPLLSFSSLTLLYFLLSFYHPKTRIYLFTVSLH